MWKFCGGCIYPSSNATTARLSAGKSAAGSRNFEGLEAKWRGINPPVPRFIAFIVMIIALLVVMILSFLITQKWISHTHIYIYTYWRILALFLYYHYQEVIIILLLRFVFCRQWLMAAPVQPRQNLRLRENIASQRRRRSFHGSSRSPMGNPFGVGFLRFFYHRFLVKLGMVYIYMVHYWICYIVRSKKRFKIRFGRMTFAMLGLTCFFGCMLKWVSSNLVVSSTRVLFLIWSRADI